MASLSNLSNELILYVFSYLGPKQLGCLAVVNKRVRDISYNDNLWKALFERRFPSKQAQPGVSYRVQFLQTLKQSSAEANSQTAPATDSPPIIPRKRGGTMGCCGGGSRSTSADLPSIATSRVVEPISTHRQMPILKLVLLGHMSTGKTSILYRLVKDTFEHDKPPTIGAAFFSKTIEVDNQRVKFEIWDTAGQERFRALAPMYYRGASVAVLVYDISDSGTFDKMKDWYNELKSQRGASDILIAVAGNKVDLAASQRAVKFEEGQKWALEHDCLFFETSAKTGQGIKELFTELCRRVLVRYSSVQ